MTTNPDATLVPVVVRAHLRQGAVIAPRTGIALDGLLASRVREHAKYSLSPHARTSGTDLDGGLHAATPADADLPLGRCPGGPEGWHWAATVARPLAAPGRPLPPSAREPVVHWWTARLDTRRAENAAERLPQDLPEHQGRYRARRQPVLVTVAALLEWRAVGDPDRIRDLLVDVHHVGGRRGQGEGAILGWTVEEHTDEDPDRYAHLHADGALGRPCPPACAARHGHGDAPVVPAAIRPPHMHPDRVRLLAVPVLGG